MLSDGSDVLIDEFLDASKLSDSTRVISSTDDTDGCNPEIW